MLQDIYKFDHFYIIIQSKTVYCRQNYILVSMRFSQRLVRSDRLTAELNTSFSSSGHLVVVVPYLCANSQGYFGKGLPAYAQDEQDEKAFDFEIVARAGRKDIKDIVPRLVLVGFEDIDSMVSLFLHSNLPYKGKLTAQIFCGKLTDIW